MSEKPLSFALASALEAVRRMKGGSLIMVPSLGSDEAADDRQGPAPDDPQQG